MKQRVLAQAIKRIVWANVALSATLAVPAFAQSQPAADAGASANATVATPAAPAAASGAAAASADKSVQKIKRFEVTGSLIRQADKTGFQSVQQISAKQIQESGETSVGNFLRSISANSANSWGESTASSFSPGGSGIALRGLSEKYTLVLVDGQRVAPYAFAVNATDAFFDLNTLPLNVVDRIEVVKTGAVSQYGSDAIAGVVNIITKKNYQGLQLDGSMGGATDGGAFTTKFGVLGGFGNLASDGYNVTAAASVYKDTGFHLDQRSRTENLDYTNQGPFGLNNQIPSYWSVGGVKQPGNCVNGTVGAAANSFRGGDGSVCNHDVANQYSGSPFTERYNTKVHADFKIDDNTTAFADVLASHNSTKVDGGPRVLRTGLTYDPTTGSLVGKSITVPGSNPYNPTGSNATYYGILPVTASSKTEANYLSFSTGVKGQFNALNREWDWATSYGHSQSIVTTKYDGSVTVAGLNKILAGGYNFDNPAATPNGLDGVLTQTNNIGVSKLDVLDATISTPKLFTLPTGDVGFGLGIQGAHQSESIEADGLTNSGAIFAPRLQTVEGSRNIGAAYYQFDIPLAGKYLSFSQSGRYDHYSDFGGVFSPRFALRSQPIDALTLYASYNRGFRAPEFLENSKSTSTGQMYVSYPAGSPSSLQYVVQSGNPNLQPERTKNLNIGFALSPTSSTDVGFDFYKIHVDKVIGTSSNPTPGPLDPSGNPYFFNAPYVNLGSMETSGFEATLRQAFKTVGYGTFTLAVDWAYVWHFYMTDQDGVRTDGAGNDLTLAQPFGGSFPRWKGNTSLTWTSPDRKLDVALAWEYTGPYSAPLQDPNAHVSSYSQFDLNFNYTGIKHWTIYGGINNIFNRQAPFDPLWIGSPVDVTGYDQSLYNNVGRFIQVGANYKF